MSKRDAYESEMYELEQLEPDGFRNPSKIRAYVEELERERDELRKRIESAPKWHVFRSKSGALSCRPTDDCEWERHSIYAVPIEDEKQEAE